MLLLRRPLLLRGPLSRDGDHRLCRSFYMEAIMQSLVELRSLLLLSHEIITIKSEAIPRTASQAVDGLYFVIYFA